MAHPRSPLAVRLSFALLLLLTPLLPLRYAAAGDVDPSKVEGIDALPGGRAERDLLTHNGFVVLPRFHKQIFSLYIGGGLPYYVTTDSAHHTYHVLFESALREIERGVASNVRAFLVGLHERLVATAEPKDARSAEGRLLAIAHVAVAARLFGEPTAIPAALEDAVAAEVGLITAAGGPTPSPLFGVPEDYALYRPRGFYADDPSLAAYFRAATWLGRRGLRVGDERETWAALHLVRAVQSDETLRTGLSDLATFLDWMVGPPDDLTMHQYDRTLEAVLGSDRSDAVLAARLGDVRRALADLPAPEINAQVLPPDEWARFRETTKGLRLLPSRRTPDAWLFQTLAEEDPGPGLATTGSPSGLDVALALGAERAGLHRAADGESGARRAETTRRVTPEFRRRLGDTHYGATLRATALLFDKTSPVCAGAPESSGIEGTPLFPSSMFGSGAWNDRLLTTGLSSWTSLRHAWVLHAKTTMMALGMTQDPAGVVEPAPRFYAALAGLSRSFVERADGIGGFGGDPRVALALVLPVLEKYADDSMTMEDMQKLQAGMQILETHGESLEALFVAQGREDPRVGIAHLAPRLRAWLDGKGTLDAAERAWVKRLGDSGTREKFLAFAALMDHLERIARVQLRGEALDDDDEALLRDYGKSIAALNFFGGNSWLEPQKQMGCIATVAADPRTGTYQEAAVGAAMELYVVLPLRGGGHRLYQGGVYAWYEFPSARPTTDAEWIARVEGQRAPPLPRWTASYVVTPRAEEAVARIRAGEILEDLEHLHDPAIAAALLDLLGREAPVTAPQDAHLTWAAMALGAYGDEELRLRIRDVFLHWIQQAPDEVSHPDLGSVNARLGEAAAVSLAKLLRPEDYPKLLALLHAPPADAPAMLFERIVIALELTGDASLGKVADELIRDDSADVRWAGLQIRKRMRYRGVGTPAEILEAVMAYLPRAETDERRLGALLSVGIRLERYAEFLRPEHVAVLAPLLKCEDDRVVNTAVEVWGHAVGTMPPDDPYVEQAATWLAERFRAGPWRSSVASLHALGGLGTPAAVEILGGIVSDPAVDVGLRHIAIASLAQAGEAALPHLFRLSFDETETGHGVNDHQIRLCDGAGEQVDRILGRRFGWPEYVDDAAARERALRAVRAEARTRGYAP